MPLILVVGTQRQEDLSDFEEATSTKQVPEWPEQLYKEILLLKTN